MKHLTYPAAALTLLLAAGCSQTEHITLQQAVFPETQAEQLDTVYDAYTDAGAYDDALLYAAHFNGSDLTPMGKNKVDAILRGAAGRPATVYVDLHPDNELAAERVAAVEDYLADADLEADVVEGVNPAGTRVDPMFNTVDNADVGGEAF